MLSDQYQELVVYLNLLLSSYHVLWNRDNLVNNQLFNYLLDQLQFFYYYHMLSCLFYGCYYIFFDWFIKKVLLINHNIVVFYFYFQKKILCALFDVHYIQMIKQKVYLHPENLDQLSNLNIGFVFLLLLLTFPVNCSLEKKFQLLY